MDQIQRYRLLAHAAPGGEGKGQDAAFHAEENGVYACAVGDGVTQAGQYAGVGAKIAVMTAVRFLLDRFDTIINAPEDRLRNMFYDYFYLYFVQGLDGYARENGTPPVLEAPRGAFHEDFVCDCSYSTTLIACAVKDGYVVTMKIGNGVIAADTGNGFGIVSPSSLPGAATPSLELMINPSFPSFSFKRYLVKDLRGIVLMSDGPEVTSPKLFKKNSRYLEPAFVEWLTRAIESRESFCRQVQVLGTQGPDDVSVAALLGDLADVRLAEGDRDPFEDCSLYVKRSAVEEEVAKALALMNEERKSTEETVLEKTVEAPVEVIIPVEMPVASAEVIAPVKMKEAPAKEPASIGPSDAPGQHLDNFWQSALHNEPVLAKALCWYNDDFPLDLTMAPGVRQELWERIVALCLDLALVEVRRRAKGHGLKEKEKQAYKTIKRAYRDYSNGKNDEDLIKLRTQLDRAEMMLDAALARKARRGIHVDINLDGLGKVWKRVRHRKHALK